MANPYTLTVSPEQKKERKALRIYIERAEANLRILDCSIHAHQAYLLRPPDDPFPPYTVRNRITPDIWNPAMSKPVDEIDDRPYVSREPEYYEHSGTLHFNRADAETLEEIRRNVEIGQGLRLHPPHPTDEYPPTPPGPPMTWEEKRIYSSCYLSVYRDALGKMKRQTATAWNLLGLCLLRGSIHDEEGPLDRLFVTEKYRKLVLKGRIVAMMEKYGKVERQFFDVEKFALGLFQRR